VLRGALQSRVRFAVFEQIEYAQAVTFGKVLGLSLRYDGIRSDERVAQNKLGKINVRKRTGAHQFRFVLWSYSHRYPAGGINCSSWHSPFSCVH
jgi:hypothetical protein